MAYEIPGFSWTLVAAEDLTDSQFCAVDIDSDGKAALPTQGSRVVGVLRNKPDINESATVVSDGIVKVRIGVTGLNPGDNVTCDDDGTGIQATNTNVAFGRCITGGSPDGVATVLLQIAAGNIVAGS